MNKKRVRRIWKAEGLQVPCRRPNGRGPKRKVIRKAEHINHVWTYGFQEDRTERGGVLRILTELDEFTRESLAIFVGPSIPAAKVIDTLEWLALVRGLPPYIRSDNGPEFVAKAVQKWLKEKHCKTIYIEPGSPWDILYI